MYCYIIKSTTVHTTTATTFQVPLCSNPSLLTGVSYTATRSVTLSGDTPVPPTPRRACKLAPRVARRTGALVLRCTQPSIAFPKP